MKLENILVDDQCNLRFIDFGMSMSLGDLLDEDTPNPNKGTPSYKAPEIETKERIQDGTKSDVFALGCILFTMYFYAYPWQNSNVSPHEHEIYY